MSALFDVSHLTIAFPENGQLNKVVDDLSFSMESGEILGVVGESGSGKSMTALTAMGLLKPDARILDGRICFDGKDILALSPDERSQLQGNDMSMIFQEPMTSLNPVMKIGRQVGESLLLHTKMDKNEIHRRVISALADVGLPDPEGLCLKYPHELSGGMRQRVMIAQAMICSPKLLIADEPTTALDVIVQEQILKLLKRLHEKKGVSILFISHDLNVIKEICQNVIVMYKGVIVERGSVSEVLKHPKHEYTKTLVASIPDAAAAPAATAPVLSMEHLNVFYQENNGGFFRKKGRRQVIRDLNLAVNDGEIMGIVGESGCGKSTLAKTIVGLNRDYTGTLAMDAGLRPQMVFQDPFGSLNPARRIGWIMSEPLRLRGIKDRGERRRRVEEMLELIGLDKSYYDRYAQELSGGQRQRISIGTALLMDSKLLVADEPVSALDVTVQSQILKLLLDIHKKRELTILLISHDLNIVRHLCHRVAVIYLGEIVEMADVREIYANPRHPYTKMLFAAALSDGNTVCGGGVALSGAGTVARASGVDGGAGVTDGGAAIAQKGSAGGADAAASEQKDGAQGSAAAAQDSAAPVLTAEVLEDTWADALDGVSSLPGCPFYPRCRFRSDRCRTENPERVNISGDGGQEHWVKCFNEIPQS